MLFEDEIIKEKKKQNTSLEETNNINKNKK